MKFVQRNLSAQRVAMDAENFGRFALVAIGLAQSGLNELLFKCTDSFVEENSLLDHLSNKGLQLLLSRTTSSLMTVHATTSQPRDIHP